MFPMVVYSYNCMLSYVLHTSCRFPCHSRQHPSLPTNWEVSHATNPPSLPGTSADVTFSYIFLRTLCTSTYCLCFTSQHQPINWPTPPTHSRFFLSWVDLCTLHSWLNIYVHLFCTYNIYVDLGAWFGLPPTWTSLYTSVSSKKFPHHQLLQPTAAFLCENSGDFVFFVKILASQASRYKGPKKLFNRIETQTFLTEEYFWYVYTGMYIDMHLYTPICKIHKWA